MNHKPLGTEQLFCSKCGSEVSSVTPPGDNRLRYVCSHCNTVHYENPKLVVGCVTEHQDKILLCKRSIEPRLGFWTVPAGFMELGETVAEAAARETLEEACARIRLGSLLAIVDVVSAGQVHVFYRGTLVDGQFAAGDESSDAQLFAESEIPWQEIAFRSGHIALKQFLSQKAGGIEQVHTESVVFNRKG